MKDKLILQETDKYFLIYQKGIESYIFLTICRSIGFSPFFIPTHLE